MDKHELFVTRSSMPPYEEYIEAIKPLWESRWLTNMGVYHRELERRLKEYLSVPQLSLMVNGHMALELAIQAFDFPKGAEIITTPFTFISTTHAIIRNDLVPVFCDVKPEDGTIDEKKIEELITEKTVAILPVHVYGNVCNVEVIEKIAFKYGLKVIYDAAHAFGVRYKKQGIGSFGDVSVFSFHATKMFNTIEGGAVTFKNEEIYEKLYNLKNFGIRNEELVVSVGANAKMNEFAAVMGLCNLNHMEEVIHARRTAKEQYVSLLHEMSGIDRLTHGSEQTDNGGYFIIVVTDDYQVSRDRLYDILKENGIHARKYFYPLTADQACFRNRYKDATLSVARNLSKRVLALPLYEGIVEEDINRVVSIIRNAA